MSRDTHCATCHELVFMQAIDFPGKKRIFMMNKTTSEIKRRVFPPSLTIQNFLSFKDKLPISLVSSVIYKYSCGQCSATYIGETRKQLKVSVTTQGYIFSNWQYAKFY